MKLTEAGIKIKAPRGLNEKKRLNNIVAYIRVLYTIRVHNECHEPANSAFEIAIRTFEIIVPLLEVSMPSLCLPKLCIQSGYFFLLSNRIYYIELY